jgi:hypothetical protein
MNERIRELAEQATQKYDRLGYEIPFSQPDLEVFAKLLIKECAEVANDNYDRGFWPVGGFIKTHFGVNE